MLVQIIANTPLWVFGLFVGLLGLGLVQTRPRRVRKVPALMLPVGMVALSLAGIESSFGLALLPLASWAIALALAASLGYLLFRDERMYYDPVARRFAIPGSWMPLVVIMAIFFAKYVYAVMRAFDAGVISTPLFIAALSGAYGLMSGYFAARAVNLVIKAAAHTAVSTPKESLPQ